MSFRFATSTLIEQFLFPITSSFPNDLSTVFSHAPHSSQVLLPGMSFAPRVKFINVTLALKKKKHILQCSLNLCGKIYKTETIEHEI